MASLPSWTRAVSWLAVICYEEILTFTRNSMYSCQNKNKVYLIIKVYVFKVKPRMGNQIQAKFDYSNILQTDGQSSNPHTGVDENGF